MWYIEQSRKTMHDAHVHDPRIKCLPEVLVGIYPTAESVSKKAKRNLLTNEDISKHAEAVLKITTRPSL